MTWWVSTYNVVVSQLQKNCLIIRNAYSYDFGGGEKFPVNLADQLKNNGFNPVIVSRSQKLLDYAQQKDITYVKGWWWSRQYWSGKFIVLFPVYCLWQLALTFWYAKLILKYRARVVHPQSRDDFIAATIAGRLLRRTVVWTDHADLKYVYQNHRSLIKNPVGKFVYIISKLAHNVTLVSNSEYSLIQKSLGHQPPKNYRVIHNGISTSPHKLKTRLAEDKNSLLFVATSRLVNEKGIRELIEAFLVVQQEYTNAKLWLFGEGPQEAAFIKLAKSNSNIVFKGYPTDTEDQLPLCDVFVHPSYHEGFSLSIVEAAKAGLPIIACSVGGNTEIVKDGVNGLLIPAKDTASLSAAMLKLAADSSLRKTYGSAARSTFLKSFVFEDIVKNNFVKLYKNIKPLKILFDANPMINGSKSGVGYYTYYVIQALAQYYPDDVRLVGHYFNFLGKKKNLALPQAPNIRYVQSKLVPGKILSITRKFRFQLPLEFFFKQTGDIALFTNFVCLPSITRIPKYIAVHDMCYEDVPEYVAKKNKDFLHTFVPISIKKAAKVITISKFSKQSILKHYSVDPSNIVITPIPPEQQSDTATKLAEPTVKGKYILFLGTLEPRKNIISLVKGYEQLPPKIKKEYALVLAGGSGWYFEETMNYINDLIIKGENIQLTGYVTDAQRVDLYRSASLFAFASHYEGFGMPILEAMSYGTPTAVSDIPVFKEVAATATVYFNKDDPASIASALASALTDKTLRTRIIDEGYKIAAAYSWDKVAEDLYKDMKATAKHI